ncbi:uncharacterized protein LOC118571887 [Onychomys torridus]|uniref:uncharacterized protein LOC118571887 n=1 Tax=Onychomys torridus TaxID=38674 RepID=UPI00167FD46B|nr:uncharacterized protein LOC118571887 [Onychomys torridus]
MRSAGLSRPLGRVQPVVTAGLARLNEFKSSLEVRSPTKPGPARGSGETEAGGSSFSPGRGKSLRIPGAAPAPCRLARAGRPEYRLRPSVRPSVRGPGSGSPTPPGSRGRRSSHLLGWCHCLAPATTSPVGPPGFPLRRQRISTTRQRSLPRVPEALHVISETVSPRRSACPGSRSAAQAGLELTELRLPLPPGAGRHRTQLNYTFNSVYRAVLDTGGGICALM